MSFPQAVAAGKLQMGAFFGVPLASSILALLLLFPLWLGFIRWMSFLALGERLDAEAVFYYYLPGNYSSGFEFSCAFFLRVAGWALVCFLPGAASASFSALVQNGVLTASAMTSDAVEGLGGLLELGGTVLFFNRVLRYFAAPFLFVTRGDGSASIRASIAVMNGFRNRMFGLGFTFFGWFLLCVFAFPAVYVFPYATESFLVAAKWIVYSFENLPRNASASGFYSDPNTGAVFPGQSFPSGSDGALFPQHPQ